RAHPPPAAAAGLGTEVGSALRPSPRPGGGPLRARPTAGPTGRGAHRCRKLHRLLATVLPRPRRCPALPHDPPGGHGPSPRATLLLGELVRRLGAVAQGPSRSCAPAARGAEPGSLRDDRRDHPDRRLPALGGGVAARDRPARAAGPG